ncbi:hypothetical protein [Pelagerythrobacter sp.]|uniref:hypothetical protein n=1 Tax=Pelagerythrobacter sp. TaxID=2800702 RepID=UPI0035B08947
MSIQFADLARSAAAAGDVSPPTLLAMQQLGWRDGTIDRHEAETLFALNRALVQPSGEWTDFFVDALCEFVLNHGEPVDACDESEARWLIGAIDSGGQPVTMAELELLVRVIERGRAVPGSLRLYALQQIEAAVLRDTGPTRVGSDDAARHVTGAECRLMRRILFASGGRMPVAIIPSEAETLIAIERATRAGDNSDEWGQLMSDAAESLLGRKLASGESPESALREALAAD